MKMKKIASALAALCLAAAFCSCEKNGEIYGTTVSVTETTPLTLTEIIETEPVPMPAHEHIEFAVFDPFEHSQKTEISDSNELAEALENISDAYALLCGAPDMLYSKSKYAESFADTEHPAESGEGYIYAPLNEEIAADESGLMQYLQRYLFGFMGGQDQSPDNAQNLHETLFGGNEPYYKLIDGRLCIRVNEEDTEHKGGIAFDKSAVIEYDGSSAEILTVAENDEAGTYCLYMSKNEEYGWVLDSLDNFKWDSKIIDSIYTLKKRITVLNEILDGKPEENSPEDIDGEAFYPSGVNMSIAEMRDYFKATFAEKTRSDSAPLRLTYTRKYIDEVYTERDGKLYRKAAAPRWYLDEMGMGFLPGYAKIHSDISIDGADMGYFDIPYNYDDPFTRVYVEYKYTDGKPEYVRFASELHIMESGHNEIELAEYDPFPKAVKVDEAVFEELGKAVIDAANAALIADGYYTFASIPDFCNEQNVIEENKEEEYRYYSVNTGFAADEEELYNYLRDFFTEDHISDEELRERLFSEGGSGNAPNFKTVNGQLCVKDQYKGVPYYSHAELLAVKSYDGNTAEIVSMGNSLSYPPVYHVFMTLKKSGGVWQLDKMELAEYNEKEVQLLYNGLMLRQDTLNTVLGGGRISENAETIEINGEKYTETDTGMTLDEMRDFFTEMFREDIYYPDDYFANTKNAVSLRRAYIEKYIDNVYTERDGKVYRKADAPVWYLPEAVTDTYSSISESGSYGGRGYFIIEQTFNDQYTGEEFTEKVTVFYLTDDYTSDTCKELYIASRLPIREREQEE